MLPRPDNKCRERTPFRSRLLVSIYAERRKQIEQLWTASLEWEENQRAAFLRDACAGDEELRMEVESLLAHKDQAESFIEEPALEVAAKGMAGESSSILGRAASRPLQDSFLARCRRHGRSLPRPGSQA